MDRVNGTIYGKVSVGYRLISEKATVEPQFRPTSLEDEYTIMQPTYVNTLPGTTSMVTPIAKSTPMTQALQMSTIPFVLPHVRDILEPLSNEQVRATYLERQMWDMGNVRLPSDIPFLEDGVSIGPESLSKRIQNYYQEKRDKRKREWETHRLALEGMKEGKEKQWHKWSQEKRDTVYAKMLQNLERTGAAMRNSISKACTISNEEHWLTLTEDDFLSYNEDGQDWSEIDQNIKMP